MPAVAMKDISLPEVFYHRAEALRQARPDLAFGSPTAVLTDILRHGLDRLEKETDALYAVRREPEPGVDNWRDRLD